MWTSFSTGLPDMQSLLEIKDTGYGTFRRHNEDGTADVYMGLGRTFRLPGGALWRRVNRGS
jgi:hypothetical protein